VFDVIISRAADHEDLPVVIRPAIPFSISIAGKRSSALLNLLTVCDHCHSRAEKAPPLRPGRRRRRVELEPIVLTFEKGGSNLCDIRFTIDVKNVDCLDCRR
jgi:hypothetical protein